MNDFVPSGKGNIRPEKYREAVLHGTPQFPMRIYENNFSWYVNNIIDWHWHPEFEFAVVLSGAVKCHMNDIAIEVNAGEGFFINSNTMHMERPINGCNPHMATICFMPEFIGDCGSDLIYNKYIAPFLSDKALRGMKLVPDIPWQGRILSYIRRLFEDSQDREWGYELRSRNTVADIWYELSSNVKVIEKDKEDDNNSTLAENRLKKMLSYIHENFQSELTVEDIARSANISKSECFRCFRNIIGKKPINYLNEYRLINAAELLLTTDMQITEVCITSGFNHISYFGKVFRKYYGVSPKRFRSIEKVHE